MALLDVRNLSIHVGRHPVVEDISFRVDDGQTLGIVGESGCGKSLTALAIMGLLQGTQVRITAGTIDFEGKNLIDMATPQRRQLMGRRMAMIFQEPMTSLNPVYRVGDQITEMILQHESISGGAAAARAVELLKLVRIPDPRGHVRSYPHQLSGGMRQRIMIAIALACHPALLIADEPTTALDVTVQAQILDLLYELQARTGMAIILISHDLGVIAENCRSVAVMYRGRIVEAASTGALFAAARHPYSRGLMASIPDALADVDFLEAIPGRVPMIDETIYGCAFHPRCNRVRDMCSQIRPETVRHDHHAVQCHYPLERSS
jgi:oligopeptide/dipeptide ABC transporter ATP-binding protein